MPSTARSSTGNLDFFNDDPRRNAERWDRERFERYKRRGQPEDFDVFRFKERDTPTKHEVDVLERDTQRGPRGRVEEREFRFHEEDRKRSGSGRPEFKLHEPTPSEIVDRALAPYRRRSIVEKDTLAVGPPARRPARPGFQRRSSSVDTHDRQPYPRYGQRERDEWRPPTNVGIPLPYRRSPAHGRRESRGGFREEEFEEVKVRDDRPDRDSEKDIRYHRERREHRRRSGSRYAESIRSESSFEEVSPPREPEAKLPGKKGRTKMPKRLVHIKAVEKLGYPYEEEEDFIFVKRALGKEEIDEVIEISKTYRSEEKQTYRFEEIKETTEESNVAPSERGSIIREPRREVVEEYRKEIVREVEPSNRSRAGSLPPPPQSVRSRSPPRTVYEERIEESNHIGGPLTIVAPRAHHHQRNVDDIQREIISLEAEKRALHNERETDRLIVAERYRDNESVDEYEWIERDRRHHHHNHPRDIVRVEKDRKVSRSRKRPDPAAVALAIATLS